VDIPTIIPVAIPSVSTRPAVSSSDPVVLVLADLRQPHMRACYDALLTNVIEPLRNAGFGARVLTLGRAKLPGATKARLALLNVEYLDWVPDFDGLLSAADVVVLPDAVGTGLKNRTVRALGQGRAVIGSPSAFEGIAIVNREHAFISETAKEMLSGVIELLGDEGLKAGAGNECGASRQRELLG
jgi:hypothetical protein